MPNYASFVGSLVLLSLLWAFCAAWPARRRAMLWTGFALAPAGPLSEWWYNRDYWQPSYLVAWSYKHWTFGVEDALFSFAFAGISAGAYGLFSKDQDSGKPGGPGAGEMVLRVLLLLFLMFVGMTLFDSISVYDSMIVFALLSCLLASRRPRSIAPALATGLSMSALMMVFYVGLYIPMFPDVFRLWFKHEFISGVALAGVPVEELLWALFGGTFCALVYPYLSAPRPLRLSGWGGG